MDFEKFEKDIVNIIQRSIDEDITSGSGIVLSIPEHILPDNTDFLNMIENIKNEKNIIVAIEGLGKPNINNGTTPFNLIWKVRT